MYVHWVASVRCKDGVDKWLMRIGGKGKGFRVREKKSGILHGFRRRELCKDNEKGWACRLGHTPDVYKQMCLT